MKITKDSPIPRDITGRLYAEIAPKLSATSVVGNPANLNSDIVDIVNKLFPKPGVLEILDSCPSFTGGSDFLFFVAGMFIGSRVRDELNTSLAPQK